MRSLFDERTILGDIEFYELLGQFKVAQKLRERYLRLKGLRKKIKPHKVVRKKIFLDKLKEQGALA